MVRFRHLLLALLVHGAVFGLLAGGASCSRPVQKPLVIEAVLLDPSRQKVAEDRQRDELQAQQERQRQLDEEQRRQQEEEDQRRRLDEQKRAVEEQRQAELVAQRKLEDERKQKVRDEALRKKKLEEDEAKRRLDEERKTKEREEAERKRKEEEFQRELDEQRRREMQEEEMQQQLAQEEQALEAERTRRRDAERDVRRAQWVAAITDKIRRNWLRPAGSAETFECKLEVEQLPGGQIVKSKMLKSCGSTPLDDSVLKAVAKSEPLPVVPDPSIFERRLIIIFTPNTQ